MTDQSTKLLLYPQPISDEEIRILTLKPATSFDDVIECDLESFPRKACGSYEALSYHWGDINDPAVIRVNKINVKVGQKLASALHYLRTNSERRLWIDAICINQKIEDDEAIKEKNAQVQSMDEVYKGASSVLVWLGPPDEHEQSDLAMNAIAELGQRYKDQTLNEVHKTTLALPVLKNGSRPSAYLPAVGKLLQRPWFNRLWVIQEVCLARADGVTMICGSCQVDFWQFANLQLVVLDPRSLDMTAEELNKVMANRLAFMTSAQEPPLVLTRQFFAVSQDDLIRAKSTEKLEVLQTRECTLLRHLWTFRNREWSRIQDHDKVYALLGLALDISKTDLKIDYSEPATQTFARATEAIIKKHKRLDILGMCLGPDASATSKEDSKDKGKTAFKRPSWVPDLTIRADKRPFTSLTKYTGRAAPCFRATNDSIARPDFAGSLSKLSLEGYDIGTINALGFDENVKTWQEGMRRSRELADTLQGPSIRYADLQEAYWRTMITNRTSSNEQARPNVEGAQFPAFWNGIDNIPQPLSDYQKAFLLHWHSRSFFTTDSGFMGLGPTPTEKDDHVCLLDGAQVPFVLRMRDPGEYQIIGEAYVHEVMDGTYWSGLSQDKKTRFVLV